MKYDKEESNILEAYKSGKMKLSTPSKKELNHSGLKVQRFKTEG